jgi:small subunit ribosomal protein S16
MDSRKPRDGEYIEQLGFYDPKQNPSIVEINNERALYWLNTGAQPTERAQKLLEISGAWTQFRVAKGDIHTIGGEETPAADSKSKVTEVTEAVEDIAEKIVEVVESVVEKVEEVVEDVTTSASAESTEESTDSSEEK